MGGGSGGGGSSGQVRYPGYVEDIHEDWLWAGADTIDSSVTEVMNDALGSSPFLTAVPYDPDADISEFIDALGDLDTITSQFMSGTGVNITLPTAITEANISTDEGNLEAQLTALKDARLTGVIIPRFEAGMRDINSVVSSAFVIGRATIESDADQEITRDVAKHGSQLRIAMKTTDSQVAELGLKSAMQRVEFERMLAQLILEAYRIKIVAKKEEADLTVEYDVADAKWDLEVFQYGANVMAAPAGGTAVPSGKKLSATSVIGGGLSGAAAGAATGAIMGSPILGLPGAAGGAIIGGLLGLGAGFLS